MIANGTRNVRVRGRPTRLTSAVYEALVDAVLEVGFLSHAARLLGLNEETVDEWYKRGKGHHQRPSNSLYARFCTDIDRAHADNIRRRQMKLEEIGRGGQVLHRTTEVRRDGTEVIKERHAPPDARALMWQLERLDRRLLGQQASIGGMLTLKHVDRLAEGLLDLFRRYVPEEHIEEVIEEIGEVVDRALDAPRILVKGPVRE